MARDPLLKRALQSTTLTAWISFGSRTTMNLGITALILVMLSVQDIAVWYLFSSVVAMGTLMDLGFSQTLVRLASYINAGADDLRRTEQGRVGGALDVEALRRLFATMSMIYVGVSVLMFLFLGVGGHFLVARQVNASAGAGSLWLAWWILSISASLVFQGKKYDSILRGLEYVPWVNGVDAVANLCAAALMAAALLSGTGILGMVVVWQSILLGAVLVKRARLKAIVGDYPRFSPRHVDAELVRMAWSPSWRTGVMVFSGQSVSHFSGVIFAQFLEAPVLAKYLLALRFITLICEFSAAPFYSRLQVFAKLRAQGRTRDLYRLATNSVRTSLLIYVGLALPVGLLAPWAFRLLGADVTFVSQSLWAFMVVAWLLERQSSMHAQLYMTTNDVPFSAAYLGTGLGNLVLLVVLVGPLGLWAAPVSQLVAQSMVINWWTVRKSLRSLGHTVSRYVTTTFLPPFVASVAFLALTVLFGPGHA